MNNIRVIYFEKLKFEFDAEIRPKEVFLQRSQIVFLIY